MKEKGKKTFSFRLKTSPPKEIAEIKKAGYKNKIKKDPVTLMPKGLAKEENNKMSVEKYNQRGEKNTAYYSQEDSAIHELYLLREEVSSLKQQLAKNQKKTEELNGQKSQQICALTYKLANTIRQKECAEEEVKLLKDKIEGLVSQLEKSGAMNQLRKKDTEINVSDIEDGAKKNTRLCMSDHPISDEEFSDVESVKSDDTVLLCTSENSLLLQKKAENNKDQTSEDDQTAKVLTRPNVRNSALSFAGWDAAKNKDLNLGVTQIQEEIKNVRDNMSIMKGLNKQLFEDLKHFSEFQKGLLTSQSTSKLQHYRGYFGAKSCEELGFVSSSNTSSTVLENKDQELGGVLARVPDLLHGSTPALTERTINGKSSSKTDKYVQASTKDNENIKGKTKISYEDEIKKADERVRQLENEDESVRQQLKRLIVNMENLRADNTEMKQELRKLSFPLNASSEILLKRTMLTDDFPYEMKQRGREKQQDSLMASEQINEASVEKTTCANPNTAVSRLETFQGQKMISEKQINFQTPAVSEERTAHDSGNENETNEQQSKSHEDLPTRYKDFLHEEMNYGIQRYIVRSSETIASLRDLKPQEIVCCRDY